MRQNSPLRVYEPKFLLSAVTKKTTLTDRKDKIIGNKNRQTKQRNSRLLSSHLEPWDIISTRGSTSLFSMISHIRGGKRTHKNYYPVCNLILCSCLLKRDFFFIHSSLHLFFTHLFIFIWTSTWKNIKWMNWNFSKQRIRVSCFVERFSFLFFSLHGLLIFLCRFLWGIFLKLSSTLC